MLSKMSKAFDITENRTRTSASSAAPQVDKQDLWGLPVDTAVLFSDHRGIYRRGVEKRQRKLLAKVSFLAPFMEEGERILQVVIGYSPASYVEQMLTGSFLHPLKRSLFVLTNSRILHIPVTQRLSYCGSIAQIVYADCHKLYIKGSTLVAGYKSGKTEKFRCVGRKGRKKVRYLLQNVSFEGRSSPTLEKTHLCPRCTKLLIKDVYYCPNCSLKFKTKSWATILSLVIPGGGYFYTRHPFLGIFETFMETLFTLLLAASTVALFISSPKAPRSLYQAVILCALMLVFEKLTTAMFSNKCVDEFIPKQRHVKVQMDKVLADRSVPNTKDMLVTNWRTR